MNKDIRLVALFLAFASFTTMVLGIVPSVSAGGPQTSNLLIKIYFDPTTESWALDTGEIDINDWPVSSTFVTRWTGRCDITMNEYAEIGMMEYDINNQWWPTGPEDSTHTTAVARNVFWDPTNHRHQAALHFRRAIAHLTNKAKYTTQFMAGMGYVMETPVPVPALEGYVDYTTLTNDTAKGITHLEAGAAAGALRIYVANTKCFKTSDWILIGDPPVEEKHIKAVGADFFDLTSPLQFSHTYCEPIKRVTLRSTATKLTAAAASGGTRLYVASVIGFSASNWIRFGNESKHVEAVGAGYLDISPTLQYGHPVGTWVVLEGLDPGYLYEYNRDLAIGQFMEGGFYDWDGDGCREWRDPGCDSMWDTGNEGPIEELPNMKVYIRIDDPQRRQAGEDLFTEMTLAGICSPPLEKIVTERSACFTAVMVRYDYNIYTGGWSLGADADFIHDLYHSQFGQYAWATNYAGFKNTEFDAAAEKVKYPKALEDVRKAAIDAQWVFQKYIPVIALWCAKGVKAYRTGWDGVVNYAGYGTDNGYSFLNMKWDDTIPCSDRLGPDGTIVWGFKSDISALHVMTSEWLWDWNVLGQIYDTLLGRNPYNLAEEVGWLAEEWNQTSEDWYAGHTGDETVIGIKVRSGATFHDGSPVLPADVAYSLLAVRDAGAGNAWNYPTVMDIGKIEIHGMTMKVYWEVESAWALHWTCFMPIVSKDLWEQAIGLHYGTTPSGYTGWIPDNTDGTYTGGSYTDASQIRNYHPWERYDMGGPALDLIEDGSGPWKFVSYVPGQTVHLTAHTGFYTTFYQHSKGMWWHEQDGANYRATFTWVYHTPDCVWHIVPANVWQWVPASSIVYIPPCTFMKGFIEKKKLDMFHRIGNVNYAIGAGAEYGWYAGAPFNANTKKVYIEDIILIAIVMPVRLDLVTPSLPPFGWQPGQFNPDADVNGDLKVNVVDLATAGLNFNKKSG